MNKRSLWFLAIAVLVALIAGWYLFIQIQNTFSENRYFSLISSSSPSTQTSKPENLTTKTKTSVALSSSASISSSTSQVGDFTVALECNDGDPVTIQVSKGGSLVQKLSLGTVLVAGTNCAPVISKDINFDGYPDLLMPSDYGTGGSLFQYWLYSTSTQEFYCPNSNGNCSLTNPTFNPATRTVISTSHLGAASTDIKTYQVVNQRLVLVNEVQGS